MRRLNFLIFLLLKILLFFLLLILLLLFLFDRLGDSQSATATGGSVRR
jgi:hypothetical protein